MDLNQKKPHTFVFSANTNEDLIVSKDKLLNKVTRSAMCKLPVCAAVARNPRRSQQAVTATSDSKSHIKQNHPECWEQWHQDKDTCP